MSLKIMNTTLDLDLITTNPEYEKLMPPLTKDEYEKLKESIKENGLWEPITVNQKNVVLDGHNRFKICKELYIIPRFSVRVFEDSLNEKLYVIDSNLIRRQLPILSKTEIGIKREEIEAEKAKQRMSEGGKGISFDTPLVAASKAARAVGLSPTTYHRAKTVLEKASPEMIQKVRNGKTSIAYAYQSLKLHQKHTNPPPLPEGLFDVILADPPWKYDYMALSGNPEEQYRTMDLEKICSLGVPSAKDAILFLWATNPLIKEAIKVLEVWGFKYITNMVWIKNGLGVGYYIRGDHELLLIGKKGNIPPPEEANRPSSIIRVDKIGHSIKPNEIYNIIEKMYPNRKYLELFARNTQPNWTSWGDEI